MCLGAVVMAGLSPVRALFTAALGAVLAMKLAEEEGGFGWGEGLGVEMGWGGGGLGGLGGLVGGFGWEGRGWLGVGWGLVGGKGVWGKGREAAGGGGERGSVLQLGSIARD